MNKKSLALTLALTLGLLPQNASADFKQVEPPAALEFPRSHGSHPEFKTEWWYFVGHLKTAEKRTFGFELTFFRVGLDPEAASPSAWRHHSIYLTHLALTDDQGQAFYHDERSSRGAFDEAGADTAKLRVWNGDWRAALDENRLEIRADAETFGIQLELSPAKPVALHGDNGFSRKGPLAGQASYYSSFTRLTGGGSVRLNGQTYTIDAASAWMDHEVTSQELADDIAGWDWFAVQMDNGEEIMVYQLRRKDGAKSRWSKGSLIQKDGTVQGLGPDDFSIRVLGNWESPETGIRYPSGWEIEIARTGQTLRLTPTVKGQELITQNSTGVTYWEGRCIVESENGSGSAYVELTGYNRPLRFS